MTQLIAINKNREIIRQMVPDKYQYQLYCDVLKKRDNNINCSVLKWEMMHFGLNMVKLLDSTLDFYHLCRSQKLKQTLIFLVMSKFSAAGFRYKAVKHTKCESVFVQKYQMSND